MNLGDQENEEDKIQQLEIKIKLIQEEVSWFILVFLFFCEKSLQCRYLIL